MKTAARAQGRIMMVPNKIAKGLFIAGVLGLTACSVASQEYANETTAMDMNTYFKEPIEVWGLFQNCREKVVKRFHVSMISEWNDSKGTLDKRFTYSDGSTQGRVRSLVRLGENNYSGTTDDVVGEARGAVYRYVLRWRYTMELAVDDDTYDLQVDDWMNLIDEITVINRSVISKFGVDVGEVILVFIKPQPVNTTNDKRGPFKTPEVRKINQIIYAVL